MGQHHKTCNLDKKEYLDPHTLGDGPKLVEQCGGCPGGVNDALLLLLAVSNGRGGGDFQSHSPLIGSWGGDRIAVIGNCALPGDLPLDNASQIYENCQPGYHDGGSFRDITDSLIPVLEQEYEIVYFIIHFGREWVARRWIGDLIQAVHCSHGSGERHLEVRYKGQYMMSDVRDALKKRFAELSQQQQFAIAVSRDDPQKFSVDDLGLTAISAAPGT